MFVTEIITLHYNIEVDEVTLKWFPPDTLLKLTEYCLLEGQALHRDFP